MIGILIKAGEFIKAEEIIKSNEFAKKGRYCCTVPVYHLLITLWFTFMSYFIEATLLLAGCKFAEGNEKEALSMLQSETIENGM